MRYSIKSDESGHDYLVKVGDEVEFEAWVEYWNYHGDDDDWHGKDFNANRVEGGLTFTNPMIGGVELDLI